MAKNDFSSKIFNTLSEQSWDKIISSKQKEISDYVNKCIFEENENNSNEMLDFFRAQDIGTTTFNSKGFFDAKSYSLDTESILSEISRWSGLAADYFISGKPESEKMLFSNETVSSILSRYVIEKAEELFTSSKDEAKWIPGLFFRTLPYLLNANTSPSDSSGFSDIISSVFGKKAGDSKSGDSKFKPSLKFNPWETVYFLNQKLVESLQHDSALSRTNKEAYSLGAYLHMKKPDMAEYSSFLANENAINAVNALDKLIHEIEGQPEDERQSMAGAASSFVSKLVKAGSFLHPKVSGIQFNRIKAEIEKADTSKYYIELFKNLESALDSYPKSFFQDEIVFGETSVDLLDDPAYVKEAVFRNFISNPKEARLEQRSKTSRRPQAEAYVAVLFEFRGALGFNDAVYEPLAQMLASNTEANEPVAFAFASYLGHYKGSADCLKGLESESNEIKCSYLSALRFNAENSIMDICSYENSLKQEILSAKGKDSKLAAISSSKEGLNHEKVAQELFMHGIFDF